MSVESVKKFFEDKGIDLSLMKLGKSGATVELASKNIGVAPELIAKTLAFKLKDRNILIVTPSQIAELTYAEWIDVCESNNYCRKEEKLCL
jgi:prolyl-tRNA editing enzyme YbaK/EbsC (Cys-tRNA(Pro) deacylase)